MVIGYLRHRHQALLGCQEPGEFVMIGGVPGSDIETEVVDMVLALEYIGCVHIFVCVNAVTMSAMVILFTYSELVDDEEFYGNPSAWNVYDLENADLGESANSEDLVKLGSTSSQAPLLQSFNAKVRDSTPKCSANILKYVGRAARWVIPCDQSHVPSRIT